MRISWKEIGVLYLGLNLAASWTLFDTPRQNTYPVPDSNAIIRKARAVTTFTGYDSATWQRKSFSYIVFEDETGSYLYYNQHWLRKDEGPEFVPRPGECYATIPLVRNYSRIQKQVPCQNPLP